MEKVFKNKVIWNNNWVIFYIISHTLGIGKYQYTLLVAVAC